MKFKTSPCTLFTLGLSLMLAVSAAPSRFGCPTDPKPYNPEYPDFYTGDNGVNSKGINLVQAIC